MLTDAMLVKKIKAGDERAFSILFHKYKPLTFSFCLSITKDVQTAEELVTDVLYTAYRKISQLKADEKFPAWLRRIARNLSLRALKAQSSQLIPLKECSQLHAVEGSPLDQLVTLELTSAVIQAIEALPDAEKQVIRAFVDGLSHKEIGEQLDIAPQTSMNQLSRIRKRLLTGLKRRLHSIAALLQILTARRIIMKLMKLSRQVKIGGLIATALIISASLLAVAYFRHTSNPTLNETSSALASANAIGLHSVDSHTVVGKIAPDFRLKTLDGRKMSLSDFRGRPVIVNFWATWCAACQKEMPSLNELAKRHFDSGLVIIGITNESDVSTIRAFTQAHGIDYPILIAAESVFDAYHVRSLPLSYLIDSSGVIQSQMVGYKSEWDMAFENHVEMLIAGQLSSPRDR